MRTPSRPASIADECRATRFPRRPPGAQSPTTETSLAPPVISIE